MATLTVQSPQHFSSLLIEANPLVRQGALQLLIDEHPDALRFARAEGSYAAPVLADQLESSVATDDDLQVLRALVALNDASVAPELVRVLMYSERAEALELAAAGLARWPDQGHSWLSGALHDPRRTSLHALAARHLSEVDPSNAALPAGDSLRSALVLIESGARDPLASPEPEGAFVDAYLRELRGPYAAESRRALEAHGAKAFTAIAPLRGRLQPDDQRWLLHWAARLKSLPALNLFDEVLADPKSSEALLADALSATEQLGPWASALAERIAELQRRLEPDSPLHAAVAAAMARSEGGTA